MIRRTAIALMALCGAVVHADEGKRLRACLEQARTDPAAGYETALVWLSQGGRPAARHCTAMALSGLGHHDEAAARLETLANARDAGGVTARAEYLALAGNLWILAGRPKAAETALTSALKLKRGDSGLLTDRARAHLMQNDWSAATSDLGVVLASDRNDVVALHLRGRARAGSGDLTGALTDIERALRHDPDNIELVVLRGDIRSRLRSSGN